MLSSPVQMNAGISTTARALLFSRALSNKHVLVRTHARSRCPEVNRCYCGRCCLPLLVASFEGYFTPERCLVLTHPVPSHAPERASGVRVGTWRSRWRRPRKRREATAMLGRAGSTWADSGADTEPEAGAEGREGKKGEPAVGP